MCVWRRVVLALLLATLPFQTVLGTTGLACSIGSHHGSPAVSDQHVETRGNATHSHDAHAEHRHDAAAHEHHATPAHETLVTPSAQEHHDAAEAAPVDAAHDAGHAGSDQCRFCLECCATAAPIPAIAGAQLGPERILRVTLLSVRVHATPSTDGLFRPPRA